VHVDGDAEEGCEGDQVSSDVAVGQDAVIGAPSVHHRIDIAEDPCSTRAGNEPGGGPSGIGSFFQNLVHLGREFDGLALGNLKNGTEPADEVKTMDGAGHGTRREEAGRPTSTWEILGDGGMPAGGFEAGLFLRIADIPKRLHRGLAGNFLASGSV